MTPPESDSELLRRYADRGDDAAFGQLVERHVNVVYAAALRQTRDSTAAEEITQRVFILLNDKARGLGPDVLLGGWLVNATRFVARDLLRAEARRRKHEQKAAAMADTMTSSDAADHPSRGEVNAILDDALGEMDETNRGLLVMRYFEGSSGRELASRLGISEDAARKRLQRAIDQLRQIFARRGVVLSIDAVSASLAACAVGAAPAGLAASATAAAAAHAAGAVGVIGKGSALVLSAKSKIAAVIFTAAVVTGAGAVIVTNAVTGPRAAPSLAVAIAPSTPPQPARSAAPVVKMITGTVRDSAGKPVAAAEVFLATSANPLDLYAPRMRDAQRVVTGADGRYAFPLASGDYQVLVKARDGFGRASSKALARSTDIRLQPWARIEGVAMAGKLLAAGSQIRLWQAEWAGPPWDAMVSLQTTTQADGTGRFVFPRVAPGQCWVAREDEPNHAGQWIYLVADAGQTAQVQVGGWGRRVLGRVAVPPDAPEKIVWARDATHQSEVQVHRDWAGSGFVGAQRNRTHEDLPEAVAKINEDMGRTTIGQVEKAAQWQTYGTVAADGSFRIDDLAPGKYALQLRSMVNDGGVSAYEDVATVESTFDIPAFAGDGLDDPLDLGTLKAKVFPRLRPGQPAPGLDLTTFSGRAWRLSDQRGKAVVLLFWAKYNPPRTDDAILQAVQGVGIDPEVSLLAIGVDQNEAESREGVSLLPPGIPAAHMPFDGQQANLIRTYGGTPTSVVVIDREGRLVVKRAWVKKDIVAAVAKALGRPPATRPAPPSVP